MPSSTIVRLRNATLWDSLSAGPQICTPCTTSRTFGPKILLKRATCEDGMGRFHSSASSVSHQSHKKSGGKKAKGGKKKPKDDKPNPKLDPELMAALLRPLASRTKRKRILIALEDEKSSRNYFDRWREQLRSRLIDITIAPHDGSMPKNVVEAAKAIKKDEDPEDLYDEVWVVFDTEGPQNPNRFTAAKAAINQAYALRFKTAVSNPA
jgi:RloB-like protein